MKCEKCGQNEATFFYSISVNGQHSERCLCAACAREEGFGGAPGDTDDLFGGFFGRGGRVLPGFDLFGRPMRSMMTPTFPIVNIVIGAPERQDGEAGPRAPLSETERKIPEDAGADVRARREIAALREQLDEAVRAEDYERAAALRDELKKRAGE